MRIGVLEDDTRLAQDLLELFGSHGHHCYLHDTAESLLGFLLRETVDVVILDWSVQGMPAAEVIRQVREEFPLHPPIVVLTTYTAQHEIIAALRGGADGYALKPLQHAVLLARIEALYERWYSAAFRSRMEQHGDYSFDTEAETVALRGVPVPLTPKEFALSLLFFRNQNRTLSRWYIFETIWRSKLELQTRTIDSHISKVRAKLDLRGAHGFRLAPVHGLGYRLHAAERSRPAEMKGRAGRG